MRFERMSASYAGLRRVLTNLEPGRDTRLSEAQAKELNEHLNVATELYDFAAIVLAYERLEAAGAIAIEPGSGPALQELHARYVSAKLHLVGFETGYPLLRDALVRCPGQPDLERLQLHYLWSFAPDQVGPLIEEAGSPVDVPFDRVAVQGEALVRSGRPEKALQIALMARADRAARMDLFFLGMNSRMDPQRKLSWFNGYLAQAGLDPVALREPGKGFGLDNLQSAAPPPDVAAEHGAPLVTVIMTAYNSERFIESAAGSILEQSYRNLELLICDDCSSDATRDRIAGLAERDRRVVPLYRSENGGTYVCKTEALRRARGTFTIFHDSDDWAHPGKIAHEVAALTADPRLIGLNTGWVRMDETGRVLLRETGRYADNNPAGTMLRTDPVREKVGGFDPVRVGADSAFRQRVQRVFGMDRWRTESTVLVLGRHHEASLTRGGSSAPLDRFGWSVPRALYRGAWLDAMIEDRAAPVWAPLDLRPHRLSAEYDYDDLFTFDRMRRLGGTGHAEDFVLVIRGRPEEAHVVQLHRLVLGARAAGYRFGVHFEDKSWIDEVWQAAHLRDMPDQHHYRELSDLRSKYCIVVRSETAGLMLRAVRASQVSAAPDGTIKVAGKPGPPRIERLRLLIPGLAEQLDRLEAISSGSALLVAHQSLKRLWNIPRTPFSVAEIAGGGLPAETMILTGKFWTPEVLEEIKALAVRLDRTLIWLPETLPELEGRAGVTPPEEETRQDYGSAVAAVLEMPVLAATLAERIASGGAELRVALPDSAVWSGGAFFGHVVDGIERRLGRGETDAIFRVIPAEGRESPPPAGTDVSASE